MKQADITSLERERERKNWKQTKKRRIFCFHLEIQQEKGYNGRKNIRNQCLFLMKRFLIG
jgi:hypothetical protein